jgi:hypothetical protein
MEDECRCHISPPCDFCISLDEGEADAFAHGGYAELRAFRRTRDDEEDAALEEGTDV